MFIALLFCSCFLLSGLENNEISFVEVINSVDLGFGGPTWGMSQMLYLNGENNKLS